MTLDDAIARDKELADYYWNQARKYHLFDDKTSARNCEKHAEMHNSYRIWLTELKNRRERDKESGKR